MDKSIIGRLPAELRNLIYEYALQEGSDGLETIYLEPKAGENSLSRLKAVNASEDERSGPPRVCGLPATCKQMRRETLALYYSTNHFYIQTEYLKSDYKGHIVKQTEQWTKAIGVTRSREIRDVTISLASFKSHPTMEQIPLNKIDWNHMQTLRRLFHPQGSTLKLRFYLQGGKTATFTLGSRVSVEEQLDGHAEAWCSRWQKMRKYSESVARTKASMYRAEVARLFVDMPEYV